MDTEGSIMSNVLPGVITENDEYQMLTSDERASYARRLENARYLAISLSSGSRRNESSDFFHFVEYLELDASYAQEYDALQGGGLSRWLTHYSWTFSTSPRAMRDSLAPPLKHSLDLNEPSSDADLDTYEAWFQELGQTLKVVTDQITNAVTYDAAMAHQMLLDVLLNRLLTACYKIRLSTLVRGRTVTDETS